MFKGANLQLRPVFQRLEHNAAKGFVGVSPCTYGCVHCLVCFGSSSWAWFCITDGKHGILGLPPPHTGWRAPEGFIFPGLCQVPLSCPHLLKCTIVVQEWEDPCPRASDSGCVYTVPLIGRLGCHGSLCSSRSRDGGPESSVQTDEHGASLSPLSDADLCGFLGLV